MPVQRITALIDVFHPPFKKWIPIQTFRYAACGGSNTLLGFLIYSVAYKYIFRETVVDLGFYALKPHVASLLLSFVVNFPIGFMLMKYVVFVDSSIRGRVQLFRYFFVFVFNLFLNYLLLKLLVEYFNVYAILAQVIATAVVIGISYLLQRHFSFRAGEGVREDEEV